MTIHVLMHKQQIISDTYYTQEEKIKKVVEASNYILEDNSFWYKTLTTRDDTKSIW